MDTEKKYYHGELEIRTGEFEFNYHYLINAETYKKAYQMIRNLAKEFYACRDKSSEGGVDSFSFFGGIVIVTFSIGSIPITVDQFIENQSATLFLGGK